MTLRWFFSLVESKHDLRQLSGNLLLPLALFVVAAVTSYLGIHRRTIELYDSFLIYQVAMPISVGWMSIYSQYYILECKGSELYFSLPIGSLYLGPARAFRLGLLGSAAYLIVAFCTFRQLTDVDTTIYACLILLSQASFIGAFGLSIVSIIKNCILSVLVAVAYFTLFLLAAEVMPSILNIYLNEAGVLNLSLHSVLKPFIMSVVMWIIAILAYHQIA